MLNIALAVVTTLLVVSLAANAFFYFHRSRFEMHWLSRETRALDRARAAELRAGQQIDAMLERVSTAPRLDLDPGKHAVEVDPTAHKFYADDDDPVEQAIWDEAHGDTDDEDDA